MKTSHFLAVAIALFSFFQAGAQLKGFSIGPYVEMAWPTGDMRLANSSGWGAGFGADIRLGKLGITGSAGYMHFNEKKLVTETPEDFSVNAIPIRAGFKYRFIPLIYAKLEGGVAKFTNGDRSALIFSPAIGLRILGFDIQAKYEVWANEGTMAFFGVKAGYNF